MKSIAAAAAEASCSIGRWAKKARSKRRGERQGKWGKGSSSLFLLPSSFSKGEEREAGEGECEMGNRRRRLLPRHCDVFEAYVGVDREGMWDG